MAYFVRIIIKYERGVAWLNLMSTFESTEISIANCETKVYSLWEVFKIF